MLSLHFDLVALVVAVLHGPTVDFAYCAADYTCSKCYISAHPGGGCTSGVSPPLHTGVCNFHHENLQVMDMQFTFKLHVGHAICIMAILRHALCNMDMQFDKKVPCGHAIFFRMHVGHAIMKHQISDMCFDIRTWRCGSIWTCILPSDMQFESVFFFFVGVIVICVFQHLHHND